jgi:hypothetical protein
MGIRCYGREKKLVDLKATPRPEWWAFLSIRTKEISNKARPARLYSLVDQSPVCDLTRLKRGLERGGDHW